MALFDSFRSNPVKRNVQYGLLEEQRPSREKKSIHHLSNELLELILDHLSPDSKGLMNPRDRASLSEESFTKIQPLPNPPEKVVDDTTHLDHFSRVCRRFLAPGRRRLFKRITVRFTSKDFEKLRQIADRPLLASSVQKFSYVVSRFYSQDRAQFVELLESFSGPSKNTLIQQVGRERNPRARDPQQRAESQSQINIIMEKAEDQRNVIEHQRDRDTLLYALSSFKNLQQVRLMRVEGDDDRAWTTFLNRHPEHRATFEADDWSRSCEHAAKTLAWALRRSKNEQLSRFSSRFMDPSSPLIITRSLRYAIADLAERLLYLDLEFVDERSHQHERMAELSELFGTVFNASSNLQCLHVGFRRRVFAPLALLFHNVQFRSLAHLGLHMWDLDSDELIELLHRHRRTLGSIRLRHISLKQEMNEKHWKKVLQFIRGTFPDLKWISLRGISYDPHTSATTHAMGGLHFAPGLQTHALNFDQEDSGGDSDISDWTLSVDENYETGDGVDNNNNDTQSNANEDENSSEAGSDHDEEENENDSDLEDEHHELSLERVLADKTPLADSKLPFQPERVAYRHIQGLQCECWKEAGDKFGWDELDDNGVSVNKDQWKKWEKWVVKSCSRHDRWDTDA